MSASNHVSISVTSGGLTATRQGFGIPAIVSHNATFVERVRYYNTITDVAADFASDSPEYLAAAQMFAQSPSVSKIAVIRVSTAVTQEYTITIDAVRNSHTYRISVKGEGVTSEVVEYTSDASATDGEIATGLVAALNAATGKNFTASGVSSPFTVTADAPGEWFSLEVDPNDLDCAQTHAASGVAAELTNALNESSDWYALVSLYNSTAYVAAVRAWAETNKRLYAADSSDTDGIKAVAGGGDTLDAIKTANVKYTFGCYHQEPAAMLGASVMGLMLSYIPGEATWKFKSLANIAFSNLSATHRTNLIAKNANFIQKVAGLPFFQESTTGNGEFIDQRRGRDWLEQEIQLRVLEGLVNAPKVPFTDAGISSIKGQILGACKSGETNNYLVEGQSVVSAPKLVDISAADKATRTLRNVQVAVLESGAIHKTIISVSVDV